MNTKKTFAAISVTALLFAFAGCQAPEQKKQTQDEVETATQPDQEVSLRINEPAAAGASDQGSPTVQQTPEVSLADRTVLQSSLQLKDPAFCEKISDTEYKATCKTVVNDQITMSTALKDLNAGQCENLSNKDLQEACKIQIEASNRLYGEKQKQFMAMEEKRKQEAELVKKIMETLDYNACSQLTIGTNKEDCQFSVAINLAVKNKDITQCQKAPRDLVELCESSYRSAAGE